MAIQRERHQGDLVLIPLLLDDYLFDGWTSGHGARIRERLAADFRGWGQNSAIFKEQFERVIRALTMDGGGREPPPESKP